MKKKRSTKNKNPISPLNFVRLEHSYETTWTWNGGAWIRSVGPFLKPEAQIDEDEDESYTIKEKPVERTIWIPNTKSGDDYADDVGRPNLRPIKITERRSDKFGW